MIFINEMTSALKLLLEETIVCKKKGVVIRPKFFKEILEGDEDKFIHLYTTTPQKELSEKQVPAIILKDYDIRHADDRVNTDVKYVYDSTSPTPVGSEINQGERVYVYFQIDFFADLKSQMVDMEVSWLQKVPKIGTLNVDGVVVSMTQVDYAVLDKVDTDRSFRRTYSYKIWGYLDDKVTHVPIVLTPDVKEGKVW